MHEYAPEVNPDRYGPPFIFLHVLPLLTPMQDFFDFCVQMLIVPPDFHGVQAAFIRPKMAQNKSTCFNETIAGYCFCLA